MVRLKNVLSSVAATEMKATAKIITFKIPLGEEKSRLGHLISAERINDQIVLKYSVLDVVSTIENIPAERFSIVFS